eukprot:TRINITY_DN38526_c0_g1_i1.p1 TRINITY_DN38526_c0_g1~~TRINITY_DN38526_c0_g1_i1.p1  ORF type:complete len:218 (+),score=8.87 TRINITY_DN38526_c0_g1_i1:180-833(+)
MVRLTMIARAQDGLALAEGLENDKDHELDQYKVQAKSFFKKLAQSNQPPPRMSMEAGKFVFHYLIEGGVCYLTLVEKGYSKKLAFQYLEELQKEFSRLYGPQISQVQRPYAFIKFDTFIQKTKKLYQDSRTQKNLERLTADLSEVHKIMTKNITEVLEQGSKLEDMNRMSSRLQEESKGFKKKATDLHTQALIKKYTPLAVIIAVIILVLLFRSLYS